MIYFTIKTRHGKNMKQILCFGDSNTFGFNPNNFKRYSKLERWSGILSLKYNVVEKGCNNRTCFNNIAELNSLETITKYIDKNTTHLILQIGINDLQFQYNTTLKDFEVGLENLIKLIDLKINIVLLCPNIINKCILKSNFSSLFDENSIEKSKSLYEIYKKISKKYNCHLINLNDHLTTSKLDGLHYDIENHKILADLLIKYFDKN